MYKLFPLLVLCLSLGRLPAQGYAYTFSKVTQPYVELEGGRAVDTPLDWYETDFALPLGFSFSLFGTPIDTLYSLFDSPANLSNVKSDEADENELLDPRHLIMLDADYNLGDRGELDSVKRSFVTYHVTGSAPNRIGVFQYKNVGFYPEIYADSISDYFTNFQLWLYERAGTIEVHFGPGTQETMAGDSFIPTMSMVVVGDYFYDEDSDEGGFTGFYYLKGNPSEPMLAELKPAQLDDEDLALSLDFVPTNGTVYRFTPSQTTGLLSPATAVGHLGVFPNPAFDRIQLSLPQEFRGRISRLELYDSGGRRVRDLAYLPVSVDVAGLPHGLYHVKLTTHTGHSLVGRVVKQ